MIMKRLTIGKILMHGNLAPEPENQDFWFHFY